MNNFGLLQSDCREIRAGLPNGVPGSLFAPSKNSIFHRGSHQIYVWCWSRFWSPINTEEALVHILNDFFNGHAMRAFEARQMRLQAHIRQIDKAMGRAPLPSEKNSQNERYAEFFLQSLEGSPNRDGLNRPEGIAVDRITEFSEDEARAHRHLIVNFFTAVSPLLDGDSTIESLRRYLQPTALIADKVFLKVMKRELRWVRVEGALQQSIPVHLFAKLSHPVLLTPSDKILLDRWVEALSASTISLKLIAKVFEEALALLRIQGHSKVTLQDLVVWHHQKKCRVLERDLAHMDWRQKLKPGDAIFCNDKPLTLGKQLSPEKPVDDAYKVFEIADSPYVVKLGNTRFALLLEEWEADQQWCIRPVQRITNIQEVEGAPPIEGLDKEGRCVVLEKLKPLPPWESVSARLTPRDEIIALGLASHFFCMKEWRGSIENFSFSHLMRDNQGVLKSTRRFKKGPSNYLALESYCIEAARSNRYILSFLMHVTKLLEHPVAVYFQESLLEALEKGKTRHITRVLEPQHRDNQYEVKVSELISAALKLREECFNLVKAKLQKNIDIRNQEQEIEREVSQRLAAYYRASLTPAHLFVDELRQAVVDSFPGSMRSIFDFSTQAAYYEEKHQWMVEENQKYIK